MASSLPIYCGIGGVNPRMKARIAPLARARSNADEGSSSVSIVDTNLGVLKERVETVRMKERLERWRKGGVGWHYSSGYDYKAKRDTRLAESMEVAELVFGTLGLTITCSTLCLCLVSLVVHSGL